MRIRHFSLALVTAAVAGSLAACAGDEIESDEMVVDTLVTQDVETVEVPVTVPDTAVVTQEMDVDVEVDTDTVDVGSR